MALRQRLASFPISSLPITSSPPAKSAAPRSIEDGVAATTASQLGSKTRPGEIRTGSQGLAPPLPLGVPSPVPKKTGPLQKSDGTQPPLAPNEVMLDLPLDVVA